MAICLRGLKNNSIYFAFLLLTACGSGGGSAGGDSSSVTNSSSSSTGGGSNNSGLVFSVEPSSLILNALEAGKTQIIYATVTANQNLTGRTLYVGTDADPSVFSAITLIEEFDSVVAAIETRSDLWAGDYQGNITFHICIDPSCNKEFGNAPLVLPYSIAIPKAPMRIEPVDVDSNVVLDYNAFKEFIVIHADSGTAGETVRFRTELSDEFGSLTFPAEMQEAFNITAASDKGFTLKTPTLEDGKYTFNYQLGYTNTEGSKALTIYYLVGNSGNLNNSFIFFEDPIKVDVIRGSNSNHKVFYLVTDDDKTLLDYRNFTIDYIDGNNWVGVINGIENTLDIELNTKDLPVGVYKARINASTFYSQIQSSVDLIVNVKEGLTLTLGNFPTHTFAGSEVAGEGGLIYVANSLNSEASWHAQTSATWLSVPMADGQFQTAIEREQGNNNSYFNYEFDLDGIAALPNNSSGTGYFTVTAESLNLPSQSIAINYKKEFPQIDSISKNSFSVGEAISITITGTNLVQGIGGGIGLHEIGSNYVMEELFNVDEASATNESLTLNHSGVTASGSYEIVFTHRANVSSEYKIDFVPRPIVNITEN